MEHIEIDYPEIEWKTFYYQTKSEWLSMQGCKTLEEYEQRLTKIKKEHDEIHRKRGNEPTLPSTWVEDCVEDVKQRGDKIKIGIPRWARK